MAKPKIKEATAEELESQIKQQQEILKGLKSKKKSLEMAKIQEEIDKKRRDDTRRKILVGALVLNEIQNNENLKAHIDMLLEVNLTKPDERELFNLEVRP
jgi:predicted transcriptional regulator